MLSPDIIERVTGDVSPAPPKDYRLATLTERWKNLEPVYHAERIREIQEESSNVK